MDINTYVAGTPFTLRIRSSLTSNRRVRWFNTWEARATQDGDLDVLLGLAATLVGFHYQMSFTYVTIDQVTISSWVPDSHPYNPLGFSTTVYNQVGSKSMLGETAVALRQTLFVKRMVSTGLLGKLFLRGCLIQDDLAYGDGEWVLADTASVEAGMNTIIASSGMANYMLGLGSEQLALAMIGDDGETRFIQELAVGGTSDVKLNHKYFDRAPTP